MARTPTTERLLAKWERDGVRRRPGADPARLAAFESRHAVRLPPDLRDYLLAVDGMDDRDLDDDLFTFWSLDRICPLHELLGDDEAAYRNLLGTGSFFCFADWSIYGDVFCIELHADATRPNRVIALGPRELPIASFGEFVDAYIADPVGLIV